jgi:hypothetical protein
VNPSALNWISRTEQLRRPKIKGRERFLRPSFSRRASPRFHEACLFSCQRAILRIRPGEAVLIIVIVLFMSRGMYDLGSKLALQHKCIDPSSRLPSFVSVCPVLTRISCPQPSSHGGVSTKERTPYETNHDSPDFWVAAARLRLNPVDGRWQYTTTADVPA